MAWHNVVWHFSFSSSSQDCREDFVELLQQSYLAAGAITRLIHHTASPHLDDKALGGHMVIAF